MFYATDYAEFTGSSNFALDGKLVDNQLGSSVDEEESAIASERAAFQGSAATKAADKKERKLFLRSMATSSPGWQVEAIADITFNPFHSDDVASDCAKQFGIPNMTDWCPPTLQDIGQLANYYKQITLEEAYVNGWGFPNAIYIDGLDWDGTIRTGTQLLNGRKRDTDHNTDAYGASRVRGLPARAPVLPPPCASPPRLASPRSVPAASPPRPVHRAHMPPRRCAARTPPPPNGQSCTRWLCFSPRCDHFGANGREGGKGTGTTLTAFNWNEPTPCSLRSVGIFPATDLPQPPSHPHALPPPPSPLSPSARPPVLHVYLHVQRTRTPWSRGTCRSHAATPPTARVVT